MIGRLTGTLAASHPPALLLDVGGVGYEIEAPLSAFSDLPTLGERVTLYTHLIVREDAHLLYGFTRESQRSLFRHLLKVNGVGPKVALAVLSGLSEQEFRVCLVTEDATRLTRVPGVGRKTAERLVLELKGKLADGLTLVAGGAESGLASGVSVCGNPAHEAVTALMTLGYRRDEAQRAVQQAARSGDTDSARVEDLIRVALRSLARQTT